MMLNRPARRNGMTVPMCRQLHTVLGTVGAAFASASLLHSMPQVAIAAISGAVGASGDMGLIWTPTRIVGPARMRETLLFAEKVAAQQDLAYGGVTRVREPAALSQATGAAARQIAAGPAFPLWMMRAGLLSAETLSFDAYVEIATARMMAVSEGGAVRAGRGSKAR